MLDGELRQWHLGFGVEWVGAVVVMALLQKCVVCGLGAGRGQWVGRVPGHPVPGLVANSPALTGPQQALGRRNKSQLPLVAHCPGRGDLSGRLQTGVSD